MLQLLIKWVLDVFEPWLFVNCYSCCPVAVGREPRLETSCTHFIRSCSIAHQIHVVSTNTAMSLYGIMFVSVCMCTHTLLRTSLALGSPLVDAIISEVAMNVMPANGCLLAPVVGLTQQGVAQYNVCMCLCHVMYSYSAPTASRSTMPSCGYS